MRHLFGTFCACFLFPCGLLGPIVYVAKDVVGKVRQVKQQCRNGQEFFTGHGATDDLREPQRVWSEHEGVVKQRYGKGKLSGRLYNEGSRSETQGKFLGSQFTHPSLA